MIRLCSFLNGESENTGATPQSQIVTLRLGNGRCQSVKDVRQDLATAAGTDDMGWQLGWGGFLGTCLPRQLQI